MTESKEYQEAVELTAKRLRSLWFNDSVRSFEKIARELLAETYPCEKGTGKGRRVLAVRARNQELPPIPSFCYDNVDEAKLLKRGAINYSKLLTNWVKVVEE